MIIVQHHNDGTSKASDNERNENVNPSKITRHVVVGMTDFSMLF